MGLFDNVLVSRIKGDVKKRSKKNMAMTILFAVATLPTALARKSNTLDLSPFTVPAEQMYMLSTEMGTEGVIC